MVEQIVLGILQGIAEWLPVSSEGLIILAKTNLFHDTGHIEVAIRQALYLHFGTCLAALIYFRRDVVILLKTIVRFNAGSRENQTLLTFLIITTMISGCVGITLIKILTRFAAVVDSKEAVITLTVGGLLLITGLLELNTKRSGHRKIEDLNMTDYLLLGVVQGFAALPGLSRSGLTVSTLLLRKIENDAALRLSFLMSLPIVLAGNIFLNINHLSFSPESLAGLVCSFAFGLATIHLLLKIAEKINFGYFVLIFAGLTILAAFI